MNGNGTKLEQVTHTLQTSVRAYDGRKEWATLLFLSASTRRKVIHVIFYLFCRGRPRPNLYNYGKLVLFLVKDKLGFYFTPFNEVQEIEVIEKSIRRKHKSYRCVKTKLGRPAYNTMT